MNTLAGETLNIQEQLNSTEEPKRRNGGMKRCIFWKLPMKGDNYHHSPFRKGWLENDMFYWDGQTVSFRKTLMDFGG